MNNKIGVIGDIHLRPFLAYSDYIEDGRATEEKEVFDSIYNSLKDCEKIIFMGDLLNAKTNKPETLKKLVELIERFDTQETYVIAGNHEKNADGTSSLDFLKEIKNPRWHVMTNRIEKIGESVFCPSFTRQELGANDNEEGEKNLMKMLPDGKILFVHHAISGCTTHTGGLTDLFDEIVLSKNKLDKKYKFIFGGHIHSPQGGPNFRITGSIFNNEIGEDHRYVYKMSEGLKVEDIDVPGRGIYKVTDPTEQRLENIPKNSIVKAVFTNPELKGEIEKLRKKLRNFDAYILLEQFPGERKKIHFDEGAVDFGNVENLLSMYAEQKKVDIKRLKEAFILINNK